MAETARKARGGRIATAEASEDSIEAEFGGDYSEASLEALRQLGRKGAQFGELEPAEKQARQPPSQAACDEALAELKEYESALEEMKQYAPDAREREWTDYKRALVEDATPEEVIWLKLKAYYHGMDALRASRGEDTAGDAPADGAAAVSADTAAATSHQSAGCCALSVRDAALRAARDLLTSSGEGEDDREGQRFTSYSQTSSRAAGLAGVSSLPMGPAASAAAAAAAGPVTIYRADYLEEVRLSQRVAQQRQQRSRAFGLSLAVALGVSVARWWVRRGRGANNGAPRRTSPPLAQ